jgi:F-type H+-transporting ATPase subunit gamma
MAGNNMRDIKRRIRSISSMQHITNAMKLVSSAKLRRAKSIFEKTQENFHYVREAIEEVFHNVEDVPAHYLRGGREIRTTAYIVITSGRGLAGSFNSNVIRFTEEEIARFPDEDQPKIIAIGSKGRDYFAKKGYPIIAEYSLPPEDITFTETHEISQPIIEMYDRGEIDAVVMIYNSFVSSLEQRVNRVVLLPFEVQSEPHTHKFSRYVEYEPSVEEVFNYLVPKYVEIMIYSAVVESATCEHAARRMAMENATDNAKEMIEDLTLTYNRMRQSAITNEISEIVSGAEALRK